MPENAALFAVKVVLVGLCFLCLSVVSNLGWFAFGVKRLCLYGFVGIGSSTKHVLKEGLVSGSPPCPPSRDLTT